MTDHFELCKLTAEREAKRCDVVFFDYQSYSTYEFPDCLSFNDSHTTLFEIKVSRPDFLREKKKQSRIISTKLLTQPYNWEISAIKGAYNQVDQIKTKNGSFNFGQFIAEKFPAQIIVKEENNTRLGKKRFYVCPTGLIQPEEVGFWGLYWVKNNRFTLKKESCIFKRNIYDEQAIILHALRKQINTGKNDRVIVKPYI